MTDTQLARRRRIARRVVLTIAIAALLPLWYAIGYVGFRAAFARGYVPQSVWYRSRPIFAPLVSYAESDLPFAREYHTFAVWGTNGRMSWDEAHRFAESSRMIDKNLARDGFKSSRSPSRQGDTPAEPR